MAETEKDTRIVTGSSSQLPTAIVNAIEDHLEFEALSIADDGGGGGMDREYFPSIKGKIILKLYFIEKYAEWKKSNRPSIARSTKKFYILDDKYQTIGLERLQYWAERVHSEFHNYVIHRGKQVFTYNDPWHAYNRMFELVNNVTDGELLFKRLTAIQEHPFSLKFCTHSQNLEPGIRYPDTPQEEEIAGHLVRLPTQRPICDIHFYKAVMRFPKTKKYFPILTYDFMGKARIIPKLPSFITKQRSVTQK
jgi:hypothetical protein